MKSADMVGRNLAALRAGSAFLLAAGTAMAAVFGPETIKNLVPTPYDTWWFIGLTALAFLAIAIALWLRQQQRDLDIATIVVAAIDPDREETGRAFHSSAQTYAARLSPMPVVPYAIHLKADRQTAAGQIDQFGRRINEFLSIAEAIVPSARRINLLITARNAAAFRIGRQIGRNHRKEILLHHADSGGQGAAIRLTGGGSRLPDLTVQKRREMAGDGPKQGCLLLNVTGKKDITLDRAMELCDRTNRFLIEVRYDGDRLSSNQKTFEAVIATAVQGWREHRPSGAKGPSIVLLDCPAVIAAGLGAQLAMHGDGPWIPYEFDNGAYLPFAPPSATGR